jgi:CRP-like cAMP-binding protein
MDKTYLTILADLITGVWPLAQHDVQLITGGCEIKPLNRLEMLTREGKQSDQEYFLLDGILHRFTGTESGDVITTGFYSGPAIVTPDFARTSDQKNIFSLQAPTDSKVAAIPAHKLDVLRISNPEIRRWGQKVVEQELKRAFLHETRFRSSSAKERLLWLRMEYPNLENLVPHTCIASIIGITPVSFSRLRKQLIRN